MADALMRGSGLVKRYRVPPARLFQRATHADAISGVDLEIRRGESVAIVGESGSGKTTLLRLMLGLTQATEGTVTFDGREVVAGRLPWLRRRTGIVFQDPYSSFDPKRTVGQSVAEPLEALRIPGDHEAVVREMLVRLDLPANAAERFPHEFSGGQRQRIAIARALVHGPDVLVGDEPVSALDVLVRTRIIDQLATLRRDLGLTLVTVTHDLGVVPQLAERVVVMKSGRIVEAGLVEQVLGSPREAYTRELVASIPRLPEGTWSPSAESSGTEAQGTEAQGAATPGTGTSGAGTKDTETPADEPH